MKTKARFVNPFVRLIEKKDKLNVDKERWRPRLREVLRQAEL